tara:strand:- start:411 stop:614 length:204 start_codon:yes stop_codon:yes gene_type:complete
MRGSWQWVVYDENNEPHYFTDKIEAFKYYHNVVDNLPNYNEFCDVLEYKRHPSVVKFWKRNSLPDKC